MPVNMYEAMFLLDSTKTASSWEDSERLVHDILRKHSAEIVASRQWDERRLAYPIEGHKKGSFLLTFFKADAQQLKDIVGDCQINELILRELILKVHPKLSDHLVNQAMNFQPSAEDESRPEEEEERPRRRRREMD